MAGDGVSLPTTLAQMGSVAKAQARAANPAQPATPFAELQEQKGELRARKVQEPGQAQEDRRRAVAVLALNIKDMVSDLPRYLAALPVDSH